MTTPDNMTILTRAFNTPLMLDPAKAAVIAPILARRLPGFESGEQITLAGGFEEPNAAHRKPVPAAASLLGDEMHGYLAESGRGYSIVGGVAVIPVTGSLVAISFSCCWVLNRFSSALIRDAVF